MNGTIQTTDNEQIETTLAFDVDKSEYPFERIAHAVIELGTRRVDYLYDLDHEVDEAGSTLIVHSRYYNDGELLNETTRGFDGHSPETYPVENGRVIHTSEGQDLNEFIEANAFADPEISVTDEWESFTS